MEQKTPKLYPSALEYHDLEQRSEKNLSDVKVFNNSVNNINELIAYFTDENHISKKKHKKTKSELE